MKTTKIYRSLFTLYGSNDDLGFKYARNSMARKDFMYIEMNYDDYNEHNMYDHIPV